MEFEKKAQKFFYLDEIVLVLKNKQHLNNKIGKNSKEQGTLKYRVMFHLKIK